ncbi:hypothetical protein JCM6292_2554 [Bacteroides pyogenes JCM 6292]|uniref:Uncharacterized protein n=1 Tax=Bacteroides pyogenes JCM 6292 TaxID=1235809 RepID=W4P8T0_9BACE|nr:hypothetical protein JCM6292_2554 [Bacteroides pyogenes JCM 6292]
MKNRLIHTGGPCARKAASPDLLLQETYNGKNRGFDQRKRSRHLRKTEALLRRKNGFFIRRKKG